MGQTAMQKILAAHAGKKEVKMGAGGPYTLKDDIYTETIEYATGEYMLTLLDKRHAFKSRVEGDKWYVSG